MDQTMSVLNSASRFDANGHFNVKQRCKDAKHSNHGWFPMGKGIGYNAELLPT